MTTEVSMSTLAPGPEMPALLNHYREYFWWWGLGLPICSSLGVAGNIIACVGFLNQKSKNLSTLTITALLISQNMFLICLVLVTTPTAWLVHWYNWQQALERVNFIHTVQRMYVGANVMVNIAHCFVIWYNLLLILEQYCVYNHVEKLAKMSGSDKAVKIIITIMNVIILVHLVQFFKFVRKPMMYSPRHLWQACMSEIYRSGGFETYDKYIYPICFEFLPWFVILAALCKTLWDHKARKKEAMQEVNMNISGIPTYQLDNVFKSGRSFKIVISLTILYLIGDLVYGVLYFLTIQDVQIDVSLDGCKIIPGSLQFEHHSSHVMFFYEFFQVIVAIVNLPLFLILGKDYRSALSLSWHKKTRLIRTTTKKMRTEIADMGYEMYATARKKRYRNAGMVPNGHVVPYDNPGYVQDDLSRSLPGPTTNSNVTTYV